MGAVDVYVGCRLRGIGRLATWDGEPYIQNASTYSPGSEAGCRAGGGGADGV